MDEIFDNWEKETKEEYGQDFYRFYNAVLDFAEYYHNQKLKDENI